MRVEKVSLVVEIFPKKGKGTAEAMPLISAH